MPALDFDFATTTPDLQLGRLNIFIIAREYPDEDWLVAAACCSHPESYASTQGPFMRIGELEHFLQGCEALQTKQHELAQLYCIEQALLVDLIAGSRGVLKLTYRICPDSPDNDEAHTYHETLDRSELRRIIRACRELLERIPTLESLANPQGR